MNILLIKEFLLLAIYHQADKESMRFPLVSGRLLFLVLSIINPRITFSYDGPLYDSSAYTECRGKPEEPLYNGGILKDQLPDYQWVTSSNGNRIHSPYFFLKNLNRAGIYYSFSSWVKIQHVESALIRVSLVTQTTTEDCIATVLAKSGCWSFLKGGFVLDSPSNTSKLYFRNLNGRDVKIELASTSLQPFTKEQWRINQQDTINKERKRAAIIHVSNSHGDEVQGANITLEQVSKDFLIGSAIEKTIIGNPPYKNWFMKRFNATVIENEIKWNAVEPRQGLINYTIADQLMEFTRANGIVVRGRSNIFWEDPSYIPKWAQNFTSTKLDSALDFRVQSLLSKYKGEFLHWDVGNIRFLETYGQKIGRPNATIKLFQTAHKSDPSATLFLNEFNVVETCSDDNSTVDTYISRLRELKKGGISINGIGLEGHFTVPNPPLIRAVLDKLATLGLPIWLTEVDISRKFSKETQAIHLEEVMREGFSHPAVEGIMLWTAITADGCYQMCLTDIDFQNLPAGDTVDKLLKEWKISKLEGQTDEHGSYKFHGFLGEYKVTASFGNKTVVSTFSLGRGGDSRHFYVLL